MADQPVYSTKTGSNKRQKPDNKPQYQTGDGPAKMRLESKGRAGKYVTVIWNLPWNQDEAKFNMKIMQGEMGCGATLKSSRIELQGDRRDKVEAYFAKLSLKILRAGG